MINRQLDPSVMSDVQATLRAANTTPAAPTQTALAPPALTNTQAKVDKVTEAPVAEPVAADKMERISVRSKAVSAPKSERLPTTDAPTSFNVKELDAEAAVLVTKFSAEFGRGSVRDAQAQWQKVKYTFSQSQSDVDVNALMNWVVQNNVESRLSSRLQSGVGSALRAELARAREALKSGAFSTLGKQADGSIKTPGGYTLFNDGGRQWRVREPDGKEHRIWGDPHVDENNDGKDDWHFDRDASFVLPDGTKIFCDTIKVGEKGAGDITVSDKLMIQFGDQLATMDLTQASNSTLADTGGLSYDKANNDGQMFVLASDHAWKDGKSLGDLYDGGGDFIADVNSNQKGSISDAAQSVLLGGLPPGMFVSKELGGTLNPDGTITLKDGPVLTGRAAIQAYVDRLESGLSELSHGRLPSGFDATASMMQMQEHLRDNMRLATILLASSNGGSSR